MCPLIGAIALLALACKGSPESVMPAERATAVSPEGYAAAEYTLCSAQGDLGDAKVWSRGAYKVEIDGKKRTVIHVAFDLENNSTQPLGLDAHGLKLSSTNLDDQVLGEITPIQVDGPSSLAPGESATAHAYFLLPADVKPQQVDAFRVDWQIQGGQIAYSQHTPFREFERPDYYYYYAPYYDPYYYDDYYLYRPPVIVQQVPYRQSEPSPCPIPSPSPGATPTTPAPTPAPAPVPTPTPTAG